MSKQTPAQELTGMFLNAIDMDRAVDALMAQDEGEETVTRSPLMVRRQELGIRTDHPGWCRVVEAHNLEDCRDKPWDEKPCQSPVRTATGWDKCGKPENTEWLHYNRDDSRAIDHEYNDPLVTGYHFGGAKP